MCTLRIHITAYSLYYKFHSIVFDHTLIQYHCTVSYTMPAHTTKSPKNRYLMRGKRASGFFMPTSVCRTASKQCSWEWPTRNKCNVTEHKDQFLIPTQNDHHKWRHLLTSDLPTKRGHQDGRETQKGSLGIRGHQCNVNVQRNKSCQGIVYTTILSTLQRG